MGTTNLRGRLVTTLTGADRLDRELGPESEAMDRVEQYFEPAGRLTAPAEVGRAV